MFQAEAMFDALILSSMVSAFPGAIPMEANVTGLDRHPGQYG